MRLAHHPLAAPLVVLTAAGGVGVQAAPLMASQVDHQRILSVHIVVIIALGAAIVLSIYLLLRRLLGDLLVTGRSFDMSAHALGTRLSENESVLRDVRRVQLDLARDVGNIDARLRAVEERRGAAK